MLAECQKRLFSRAITAEATLGRLLHAFAALHCGLGAQFARAADFGETLPAPLALGVGAGVALVALLLGWWNRQRGGSRAIGKHIRAAVEFSPDAILIHSNGRYLYANRAAAALLRAASPDDIIGRQTLSIVHPADHDRVRARIERMRRGLPNAPEALRLVRVDGSEVDVEASASPFHGVRRFSIQVFLREITERKQAERKLQRVTNLYKALLETSDAVSRHHERDRMLQETCRVAVEFGGLRMTWIGRIDEAQRRVKMVAAAGVGEEYARDIFVSTDPSLPEGRGLVATALREGRPLICNEFEADGHTAPWRERATRFGFHSLAVFPLREGGSITSVIVHYAPERHFFDDELTALLERMAGEINLALDSIASGERWAAAEEALMEKQREMETLLSNLPGMAYRCRYEDKWTMEVVSEGSQELTGYRPEELLLGRLVSYEDLTHVEDRGRVREEIGRAVAARTRYTVEYRIVDRNGAQKWVWERGLGHYSETGEAIALDGFISDISEIKHYREQLEHQASHDTLTGLPNRSLLQERLRQALAQAMRQKYKLAVAFLDLDNFKYVNDSLGHSAGDELLKVVAHRLKSCVRETDTVARLGGDEFVLLLVDHGDAEAINRVMRRVLQQMSEPCFIAGQELHTGGSLGVSVFPEDGSDADVLLKHADAAMYRAKAQGRNSVFFFTADINAALTERLALEKGLRQALERGEFRLDYQPRMDVASGRLTGAEALVRWEHPEHGLLSPARFVPVAEETGLIVPLGNWILREACLQVQRWRSSGLALHQVSINMSARQFGSPTLVDTVADVLRETGLLPACLDLEITESLMMENVEAFTMRLHALKNLGVQLSVDDFGTGYSSLNYLRQFPVDRLKIDRSFVRDIAQDASDAAIVLAVIQLGHVLGLSVTAEGVESAEQLAFLRRHGCDEVQGYYLSPPISADAFEAMLTRNLQAQSGARCVVQRE